MRQSFGTAGGSLAHNRRNYRLPTRDELYLSGDPKDRTAFFDGEEGFDFASEPNDNTLCPRAAAKLTHAMNADRPVQQQQKIKTIAELEAIYLQQQQQQPQM